MTYHTSPNKCTYPECACPVSETLPKEIAKLMDKHGVTPAKPQFWLDLKALFALGHAQIPQEQLPNDFIATALLTTLDVMRSANRQGVGMSIWDRDLAAVEAAITALSDTSTDRPGCPKG